MKHIFYSLLCLLLLAAGGKATAQQVVLHYPDGRQFKLHVSELDSISFHSDAWHDPTGEPNRVRMTLVADFDERAPKSTRSQRRIHMGTEGSERSMLWETGDNIWVGQPGNLTRKFSLASGEESKQGEFTGIVLQGIPITAIYPYQEGIQLNENGKVTSLSLPTTQKATAGSCDPRVALMMATAQNENTSEGDNATVALSFKNICSYIEITPTEALSQVTITAHDANGAAVPLGGTLTATYNSGEPTWEITKGSNTVTLDGPLESGKSYYIAVLPGTKAAGFSITCCKGSQSKVRHYNGSATFNRSKYHNCSAFTTGDDYSTADYVDLGLEDDGIHRCWATRNLGAGSPTDFGSYFAWGVTNGLKSWDEAHFDWQSYAHGDGYEPSDYSSTFVSKYNSSDGLTLLTATDDAATQLWGTDWQMPTQADYKALNTQCHKEYTRNYKGSGVNGYIYYKVGHQPVDDKAAADEHVDLNESKEEVPHIFLPWGGYYQGNDVVNPGAHGYYWSSEVEPSVGQGPGCYNYARAYDFVMTNQPSAKISANLRHRGQSIRAVYVGGQQK